MSEPYWVPLGASPPTQPPPGARVIRTTVQSIPNSTVTAVSFDTVMANRDGCWAVGQPTRLTCQAPGTYVCSGLVQFAMAAGGLYRAVHLRTNGVYNIGEQHLPFNANVVATGGLSTVNDFALGDWLELMVFQDSGAALNLIAGGVGGTSYAYPVLTMRRLA